MPRVELNRLVDRHEPTLGMAKGAAKLRVGERLQEDHPALVQRRQEPKRGFHGGFTAIGRFGPSATRLEERGFATYTTSSEWLGQVGEAIREFRAREGKRVPANVAELLDQCLTEVGKVWPKYK